MLTGHRNEDLAEILEDVEAGTNLRALLPAVVGTIIELRKAAHYIMVPPTNFPDEGDSGAEEEQEEEGEEVAVAENAVQYFGWSSQKKVSTAKSR